MDNVETRLINRAQFLAHKLFVANPEGVELLQRLKMLHVLTPIFPQSEQVLAQHGGALGWAGYREGQVAFIHSIEQMARQYADKLAAENSKPKE